MKKHLFITIGIFCLVLFGFILTSGTCYAQSATKPIEWKCPTTFPATNQLVSVIWQGIVDDIYKRTNGRLKITIYPGGELGYPAKEMLRFLRDGVIPIAEVGWPYAVGDFPLGKMCANLFIAKDFQDWYKVLHPIWLDAVKEPLEKNWNAIVLIHVPFSYIHLWTNDKPIKSLGDFKGKKIRIWEAEMGQLFEELGATTTYMGWGDVYTGMQRRVIDGFPTGYPTIKDAKLNEVSKYCTECAMIIPDNSLVINKKAFAALPADIRDIVIKVGQEWQQKCIDIQQKNNDDAKAWCIKNGVTVVKMPDAVRNDLEKVAKKTWEGWAKKAGPRGQEALLKLEKARKAK